MHAVIGMDIRADIGGDQQVIQHMQVEHADTTFKSVFLPVWVAAFRFVGRPYRFVVNGRTGEVHGERPWSAWKIAGAVVLGALLLLLLALLFSQAEGMQAACGRGPDAGQAPPAARGSTRPWPRRTGCR